MSVTGLCDSSSKTNQEEGRKQNKTKKRKTYVRHKNNSQAEKKTPTPLSILGFQTAVICSRNRPLIGVLPVKG